MNFKNVNKIAVARSSDRYARRLKPPCRPYKIEFRVRGSGYNPRCGIDEFGLCVGFVKRGMHRGLIWVVRDEGEERARCFCPWFWAPTNGEIPFEMSIAGIEWALAFNERFKLGKICGRPAYVRR